MILEQYNHVNYRYPGLKLSQNDNRQWIIKGELHFYASYNDMPIEDKFEILIYIPEEYPIKYPRVLELGNRIPRDFHHYTNDFLCLGTPHEINTKLRKNPTLLGFVEEHIIPYLYGFCYQEKNNGEMPFGEWKHDGDGIIEYYQQKLGIESEISILAFLSMMADNRYNDNLICSCGGSKILGKCHASIVKKLMSVQHDDYFYMEYLSIQDTLIRKGIKIPYSVKSRRFTMTKSRINMIEKR